MHSEEYLAKLKACVDEMYIDCGEPESMAELDYVDGLYGIMMRNELQEIRRDMDRLRSAVDSLYEDSVGQQQKRQTQGDDL